METIRSYVSSCFSIIEACNNIGLLDVLGIILSSLIPILIMHYTLKSEKKVAAEDALEREKQHHELLENETKRHQELVKTQNDINRISIMPYLIKEEIKAHRIRNKIVFDIVFSNIGNGAAVELSVKYLYPQGASLAISDTLVASYVCISPFDEFSSVVQPNNICRFSVQQELKNINIPNIDCFSFAVCFKDMRMNRYEQEFSVLFDGSGSMPKISRVTVASPEHKD